MFNAWERLLEATKKLNHHKDVVERATSYSDVFETDDNEAKSFACDPYDIYALIEQLTTEVQDLHKQLHSSITTACIAAGRPGEDPDWILSLLVEPVENYKAERRIEDCGCCR
jgi:hypothetical protein